MYVFVSKLVSFLTFFVGWDGKINFLKVDLKIFLQLGFVARIEVEVFLISSELWSEMNF